MQGIPILLAQTDVNPGTNSSPDTPTSTASETSAVADFFDTGAMGLLLEGGPFMWPILLMALVGLAVIIERWRSLKMLGGDNTELKTLSSMISLPIESRRPLPGANRLPDRSLPFLPMA